MSGIRAIGLSIVVVGLLRILLIVGPDLVSKARERPLVPLAAGLAGVACLAILLVRRRKQSIADRRQRFAAANEAALSDFEADVATGWVEQMQGRQAASNDPTERTWDPPPAPPVSS